MTRARCRTLRLVPALLLTLLVPLVGCSEDEPADAREPASSSSEADDATPTPAPSETPSAETPAVTGPIVHELGGWRVTLTLDATDRYKQDFGAEATRVHLLPVNVIKDPTAERWADIFVWAPTRIYDPVTQKRRPLPADPVAWLRANPGGTLLREKRVELGDAGGHRGWQFDLDRDGRQLFGDREGGLEGDGFERLVLWQVDTTWFLALASTFRDEAGLLASDDEDDVLRQLLASATYERL